MVREGKSKREAAAAVGASSETVRIWVMAAGGEAKPQVKKTRRRGASSAQPVAAVPSAGTPAPEKPPQRRSPFARSPYAPRDPGQGLAEHEVKAIVEIKQEHPSMGPAQIRAQLKRFKGWRLSIKAIARVLKAHGFPNVRNALWMADYAEVRVGPERLYLLVVIDDFSRYVVGHALGESPSSDVAVTTLKEAIARHGKPEAIRTDRGGAFLAFSKATDFGRYLEAELIDHVVGRAYHPQGGGKVEAVIGTIRRELWDVEEFPDRETATRRLATWLEESRLSTPSPAGATRLRLGKDGVDPSRSWSRRAGRSRSSA
jgi:transposase InsO family protein